MTIFTVSMHLIWFDMDTSKQPYGKLIPKDLCIGEHQQLSLEASRQGIVPLKNDGSFPLASKEVPSLDGIGPNENVTKTMIGNYVGMHLFDVD